MFLFSIKRPITSIGDRLKIIFLKQIQIFMYSHSKSLSRMNKMYQKNSLLSYSYVFIPLQNKYNNYIEGY